MERAQMSADDEIGTEQDPSWGPSRPPLSGLRFDASQFNSRFPTRLDVTRIKAEYLGTSSCRPRLFIWPIQAPSVHAGAVPDTYGR
ncbi:hypothetical protein AG1IA_04688 [Rhizoctonia solani AG-1 IA]|uniref:Uncharacterized protein n=1 Tax=Thanatephorus cucumeris (strain AG1-IA) TaxID=983506 RepID=L8WY74_THACA|nr:hypothetical protein AG1IA_04688 [Rhizoctonia solani AG-1 IA]